LGFFYGRLVANHGHKKKLQSPRNVLGIWGFSMAVLWPSWPIKFVNHGHKKNPKILGMSWDFGVFPWPSCGHLVAILSQSNSFVIAEEKNCKIPGIILFFILIQWANAPIQQRKTSSLLTGYLPTAFTGKLGEKTRLNLLKTLLKKTKYHLAPEPTRD
jgi:hypothetical protein